jgi:hypothetical protein
MRRLRALAPLAALALGGCATLPGGGLLSFSIWSPALPAHRAVPDSLRALLALAGRWASSRFCVGRR